MNSKRRCNPQVRRLIEQIFQKGEYREDGLRAIKTLATMGEPALREMLAALEHPPKSNQHPIDLWETIFRVFREFARTIPDSVMDQMDEGTLSPRYGYWALGAARGRRSIDVLIAGLKHKDPEVRWTAANALVERRNKRAVPALLEALRDRSDWVKSTVVWAMQSNRMYRRPEAIPALQRILANQRIRKSSPGLWQTAAELVRKIDATK
jgi:HEAT repeat protein